MNLFYAFTGILYDWMNLQKAGGRTSHRQGNSWFSLIEGLKITPAILKIDSNTYFKCLVIGSCLAVTVCF